MLKEIVAFPKIWRENADIAQDHITNEKLSA